MSDYETPPHSADEEDVMEREFLYKKHGLGKSVDDSKHNTWAAYVAEVGVAQHFDCAQEEAKEAFKRAYPPRRDLAETTPGGPDRTYFFPAAWRSGASGGHNDDDEKEMGAALQELLASANDNTCVIVARRFGGFLFEKRFETVLQVAARRLVELEMLRHEVAESIIPDIAARAAARAKCGTS